MAEIKIDVTSISPEARYQLARGCLELYHSILAMPGGREMLDAMKEKMRMEERTNG